MTNETHETLNTGCFEPLYLVTLDEIYHSHWAARKRLRIKFLRDVVLSIWPNGHPSRLIQVTGTNGKGSVVYYLEQGLRFAGKTGSWTGPHVFDYAERFHLNGQIVSHHDMISIYRDTLLPIQDRFMQQHPGESLSFAELGILLSLFLFEKYAVQWGIMEVGAGGRYTPLMALDMAACILTNVGYDHPQTLGTELWQRALEKAGIARPGIPFFTAAEGPALAYVQKAVAAEGAPLWSTQREEWEAIAKVTGKLPEFKLKNLALAVNVMRHFYPEFDFKDHAQQMTASLPARFYHVAPNIIADMAHNKDKIARLVEQLKHAYPQRKFRFLIGLSRSRDVRDVFAPVLELADHIVVTSASYAGQNPHEVAALLRQDFPAVTVIEDPKTAFEKEKEALGENDMLVLTGSAYMIDQAINPNPYIKHLNATFGRRVTSV